MPSRAAPSGSVATGENERLTIVFEMANCVAALASPPPTRRHPKVLRDGKRLSLTEEDLDYSDIQPRGLRVMISRCCQFEARVSRRHVFRCHPSLPGHALPCLTPTHPPLSQKRPCIDVMVNDLTTYLSSLQKENKTIIRQPILIYDSYSGLYAI